MLPDLKLRSRVVAALVAGGTLAGCSDPAGGASPTPNACPGVALRVVIGPLPTRPGEGVRVFGTSANGRSVEAVADAQGAVCVPATDSDGAWTFTFARAGHGLTTLVGVPRAGVEGPVRIDALVDTASRATVPISGQLTGGFTSGSPRVVDVLDGDTVMAMGGAYQTRYVPGSSAPLLVSALELNADGDLVDGVLVSTPRTGQPVQLDLSLPTPRRVPRAISVTIVPPSEGVLTAPSQVVSPPLVAQFRATSSDTAYVTVGSARVVGSSSRGLHLAVRSYDDDMLPDGLTIGLAQPSMNLSLNVWAHALEADTMVSLEPLREFSLAGGTASSLTLHAVAPAYSAAEIVLSRNRAAVPSWRIIPATNGADVRVPPLPAGVNPADHHLDDPMLYAQGLVVRMHAGTPWGAPAYNYSVVQFEYTVGGPFVPVRNDLR